MKTLLSIIFLVAILFLSCGENTSLSPEETLEKQGPKRIQSFEPMQPFEYLPSNAVVDNEDLNIHITDEFLFVRSRNFFVEITYTEYSILLYIGETSPINFTLEGYGNAYFQSAKVFAMQGD